MAAGSCRIPVPRRGQGTHVSRHRRLFAPLQGASVACVHCGSEGVSSADRRASPDWGRSWARTVAGVVAAVCAGGSGEGYSLRSDGGRAGCGASGRQPAPAAAGERYGGVGTGTRDGGAHTTSAVAHRGGLSTVGRPVRGFLGTEKSRDSDRTRCRGVSDGLGGPARSESRDAEAGVECARLFFA